MNNEKSLTKAGAIVLIVFLIMSICMFCLGRMYEQIMNEQRGQVNKDCVSETKYVIVRDTIRFKK